MEFRIVIFIFFNVGVIAKEHQRVFHLGKSCFAEIRKTDSYIDKTMLIKEFYSHDYVLITAPPKFGKSTNMDMLRRFFEIQVDRNGTALRIRTENFKIFTKSYRKHSRSVLLDIYKEKPFFNKHFSQYPVIYLDFKTLSGESFEYFLMSFRLMLMKLFASHEYLLRSVHIDERQKSEFRMYCDRNEIMQLHPIDLQGGLRFLSQALNKHFNTKVMVFIDEYDAPIQKTIFEFGSDLFEIIRFVRDVVSNLFTSNTCVEKALLNANTRLAGVFTTDANNVKHFYFSDKHPFSPYYGLTDAEAVSLTKKFKITNKISHIRMWYNGYRIPNSNLKILNLYSVVNYLNTREFANYWISTGHIVDLERILSKDEIKLKMDRLLDNRVVNIPTVSKITIDHIHRLSEMVNDIAYFKLSEKDVFLFLNFMLDLGYFTISKKHGLQVSITIPNKEIRTEFKDHLHSMSYFKQGNSTVTKVKRRVSANSTNFRQS